MKLPASCRIILFVLLAFSTYAPAQSMRDLLLMLPDDATPGLDESGRKALIKEGEYTISGKRDEDEIDYAVDTATDNYLSYEYSSSNGKGINITYTLKKFKLAANIYVLFFTTDGDIVNKNDKYVFKAYDIKGKSLEENQEHLIQENLGYSIFVKPETPDSIKSLIGKISYCTFDLGIQSADKINFQMTLENEKYKKWLIGDTIEFQWNGTLFVSNIIFRKEDE